MQSTTRRYLIAGNWKMNKTAAEAADLVDEIKSEVGQETEVGVVVCPPFTALESVARKLEDNTIQLGAQNMHPEPSGAYTGEVSAEMLRHLFVTFVILGHSERRQYFGEDDAFVNRKLLASLENSLKPILCVGETLEQRDDGSTLAVVQRQVEGGLAKVSKSAAEQVVVAYEPVWAIGTGRTATPAQAQEVHAHIRQILKGQFGETVASKIRILYGGSMKPDNAGELMDQADIDGGLIGGASLDGKSFVKIVKEAVARS